MKTQDLKGIDLNWFVAKALGLRVGFVGERPCHWRVTYDGDDDFSIPNYEGDLKIGGEVMEKFRIEVYDRNRTHWGANIAGVDKAYYGDTFLQAAMRSFVAFHYGNEVSDDSYFIKDAVNV
jgi:hypothetical protein